MKQYLKHPLNVLLALSLGSVLAGAPACSTEPKSSGVAAKASAVERSPSAQPSTATATDASAPKAALPPHVAAVAGTCDKCRARWCQNYEGEGFDVVKGCFERPDPKLVPSPDANFATDCVAAYQCAFKHNCGYDPARGPVKCYCGSHNVDDCRDKGPAKDAPCVEEWKTATRGTTNMEVLTRFDQVEFPSGWAFHLIECDRNHCGRESGWGTCTP